MKRKNEEITFKDILSVFIPKMWIIAIASVLLAVVFALYTIFMVPDTYTATYKVNIKSNTTPSMADIQATDSVIESKAMFIYSNRFCEQICTYLIREYGSKYNSLKPGQVKGAISYIPQGNGNLVLYVTTGNEQLTAGIAKALSTYVPDEFYNHSPIYTVTPIEDPAELIAPNSKNTSVNAVIGFCIGAIASAAAVWVYSMIDVTVRDKKKLTDSFDIPVLGVIPTTKRSATLSEEVK